MMVINANNEVMSRDWNQFELLGGSPCLDFANTVNREESGESEEWLDCYEDLVNWSQREQILTDKQAKKWLQQAKKQPERAKTVFDRAISLRETIYRIFAAIARDNPVATTDLADLNAFLTEVMPHLHIAPAPEGYHWTWKDASERLDAVLWQVVRSAGELLAQKECDRVRQCAADDCSFLFIDMSRNRRRCWCNMEDCGNRFKAKRHYERQKRKHSGM